MLRLFRNNHLIHSIALLGYAIILQLPVWLLSRQGTWDGRLGYAPPSLYTGQLSSWGWNILTIVLIWIAAAQMNRLVIRNRMMHELHLFPGMCYILLVSSLPVSHSMHIIHVAVIAVLLAIDFIYQAYKTASPKGEAFDTGAVFSIASILYFPLILYLPLSYIALMTIRVFRSREQVQLLLGWLAPLVIAACLLIGWWGKTPDIFQAMEWRTLGIPDRYATLLIGGLILLCTSLCVLAYPMIQRKKNNQAIKKINILYWFLLWSIFPILLTDDSLYSAVCLGLIPMSMLIGMLLGKIRPIILAESIHLAIFALVLLIQYLMYRP